MQAGLNSFHELWNSMILYWLSGYQLFETSSKTKYTDTKEFVKQAQIYYFT